MANSKKVSKNVSHEAIGLRAYLELLCAGQVITTPANPKLHSGTGKLYNEYKNELPPKVNTCVSQDRDAIFDSFPSKCKFGSLVMELDRQQTKGGATKRVINFKTELCKQEVK